jgi:hypothetical protein
MTPLCRAIRVLGSVRGIRRAGGAFHHPAWRALLEGELAGQFDTDFL